MKPIILKEDFDPQFLQLFDSKTKKQHLMDFNNNCEVKDKSLTNQMYFIYLNLISTLRLILIGPLSAVIDWGCCCKKIIMYNIYNTRNKKKITGIQQNDKKNI